MEEFHSLVNNPQKIIVHGGAFHADDVFCVAAMKILNPDVEIERWNEADCDYTDLSRGIIMADIGGGCFDHHQKDTPIREDGITHCAVTRLWLAAGLAVVKKTAGCLTEQEMLIVASGVYNGLFRTVALMDNGISKNEDQLCTICSLIERFIPEWNGEKSIHAAFIDAVNFAEEILLREIKHQAATVQSVQILSLAIDKRRNGIIVLDRYIPWEKLVCDTADAAIVIYPSNRGGYNLQLVPIFAGSFETRIQVPESWRGKQGEDADLLMKGMTFCHINGFLSCFTTLESAEDAADYIMAVQEQL